MRMDAALRWRKLVRMLCRVIMLERLIWQIESTSWGWTFASSGKLELAAD